MVATAKRSNVRLRGLQVPVRELQDPKPTPMKSKKRPYAILRALLYSYILLWIFEGALRKWVFPSFSEFLFFARDPIVGATYVLAFRARLFPKNWIVWAFTLLGVVSAAIAILFHGLPIHVVAVGYWSYFWPIPMIYIYARIFDQTDVKRILAVLIILSLPIAVLEILQFQNPAGAKVNAIVGQTEYRYDEEFLKYGRVRPSGTFAYVGGSSLFFTLIFASAFVLLFTERRPWLAALGLASSAVSLSVCHSRTQVASYLIALLILGVAMGRVFLRRMNRVALTALFSVALAFLLLQTPFAQKNIELLSERFFGARTDNPIQRFWYDVLPESRKFQIGAIAGYGLGVGTQAGAYLLVGRRAFLLAEGEVARLILELGLPLGLALIGLRVVLMVDALFRALGGMRRGNVLPLSLFACVFIPAVSATWSLSVIQGFIVWCTGLVFAASKEKA